MPNLPRKDSAVGNGIHLSYGNQDSDPMASKCLDLKVLGVSSNSGLTKCACILVHYRQKKADAPLRVEVLKVDIRAVSSTLRNPILNSLRDTQRSVTAIPHSNNLVGQMFCITIKTFCERCGIDMASIDLAGLRIQTIGRLFDTSLNGVSEAPRPWWRMVAEETGITTTADFYISEQRDRRSPIPPITFVDRLLLEHPTRFRACLRIDELANMSFIPPTSESDDNPTISHDCGPGTLFIDYAMRYCTANDHSDDNAGSFAARGKVNQDVVDRFLQSHNYVENPLPISIATEMFGDHDAQHLVDECIFLRMTEDETIATITRITAQNILRTYQKHFHDHFSPTQKVDELFICGPGAHNTSIVDFLESALPENVTTKPLDDIGIPGSMNSAYCYAHLALEAVLRRTTAPRTINSAEITGTVITGRIAPGSKWKDIKAQVQRFSEGKPLQIVKRLNIAGDLEAAFTGLHIRG